MNAIGGWLLVVLAGIGAFDVMFGMCAIRRHILEDGKFLPVAPPNSQVE